MDRLIEQFHQIVRDFRRQDLDLLDVHNNLFDKACLGFNRSITDLETSLQTFINQSFDNITSIEHSLQLLKKFQVKINCQNY